MASPPTSTLSPSSPLPTSTLPPAQSCIPFPLQRQIPTHEIACAIPSLSNATAILTTCCKTAPIIPYPNNCGYYCLALDQTVGDLVKCMQANGVRGSSVFCNGEWNQSAVATGAGKGSKTATGTTTGGGGTKTGEPVGKAKEKEKEGVAAGLGFGRGISKAGLGMVGMVFVSFVAGMVL